MEVRLKVTDKWKSAESEETPGVQTDRFVPLRLGRWQTVRPVGNEHGLYMEQPDGSERAMKGSYVNLSASVYAGARPIKTEPVVIKTATET